jgi:hypothetical protein
MAVNKDPWANVRLDDVRLDPTPVRERGEPETKIVTGHEQDRPWPWIRYGDRWRRCLRKTNSLATCRLADWIQEKNWRVNGHEFRLPDNLSHELGCSRNTLNLAAHELAEAGLITVFTVKGEGTWVRVMVR